MINELIQYNIEPIITIYHWDLPQGLQDQYGGWESRKIIDDFNEYCITLYKRYGDRVKYWVTLNEQNVFITHGYEKAVHPPKVTDKKRMYEANHIASLANAKAIQSFRKYVPNGKIGPSFAFSPIYAFSSKPEDVLALENVEEISNYWWLDVYCWGEYPKIAWKYLSKLGLAPTIEAGDIELLKAGKPDFMGVNYYRSGTVEMNPLEGGVEEAVTKMNTTGKKVLLLRVAFLEYLKVKTILI